jgi:putative heme-binding domain-containing protein
VPAWADHRVERYTLKPKGASFTAERKPFIQGGKDFYPSGLAVAPDGSLFVTDWGSKSYELQGRGAVWHIRWKDAKPAKRPADPYQAFLSPDRRTREAGARKLASREKSQGLLRVWLNREDVRVRATALAALIAYDASFDLAAVPANQDWDLRAMAVRELAARGANVVKYSYSEQREEVRAAAFAGLPGERKATLAHPFPDPFMRHAAVQRLAKMPDVLSKIDTRSLKEPIARIGILLAWRASGHKDAARKLADFLNDPDPDVRLLAVKWVADEKLVAYRPQIVEALQLPVLDPREFVALSTALARLDDKPVNENSLAEYFLARVGEQSAPVASRLMALRAVPAAYAKLRTDAIVAMLKENDGAFRIEVLRLLKDRGDAKAAPAVRAIARDVKQPDVLRAQAVLTLAALGGADAELLIALAGDSDAAVAQEALRALVDVKLSPEQSERLATATNEKKDFVDLVSRILRKPIDAGRPEPKDTAAWLKRLDGPADAGAGRRVFEHPKLAACSRCHQIDGRGANVGPDLGLIGRTERKWIVESILQPSAVVAPHYQAWKIVTADERTRTGLLVRTYLDESEYIDEKGERFKVLAGDVLDVSAATVSIMPDNLVEKLTDQEIRDLVAYLASRK